MKRYTEQDYANVLAEYTYGPETVLEVCERHGMPYRRFLDWIRDDESMAEQYEAAKRKHAAYRVEEAWRTLEAAMRQRNRDGQVTSIALKAAMAVLYSRGELVDSRYSQTVTAESQHGKLVVTFGSAEKPGGEAEDGGGEG